VDRRVPAPGLVHHSDRGIQSASQDYTDLLKRHSIHISMSRNVPNVSCSRGPSDRVLTERALHLDGNDLRGRDGKPLVKSTEYQVHPATDETWLERARAAGRTLELGPDRSRTQPWVARNGYLIIGQLFDPIVVILRLNIDHRSRTQVVNIQPVLRLGSYCHGNLLSPPLGLVHLDRTAALDRSDQDDSNCPEQQNVDEPR